MLCRSTGIVLQESFWVLDEEFLQLRAQEGFMVVITTTQACVGLLKRIFGLLVFTAVNINKPKRRRRS